MARDDAATQAEKKPSRKPADTAITQQRLPACKPVLDPCWVVFIFVSIGVILIPVGAVCYAYGTLPQEIPFRYDDCFNDPSLNVTNAPQNNKDRKELIWRAEHSRQPEMLTCTKTLDLKKKMTAPIYVFYQLEGFYQNHRRYVKSRSDAQLAGLTTTPDDDCKPEQNYKGNKSQPILPCGLVAWSYFNDTFKVKFSQQGTNTTEAVISSSGLASSADKRRFANVNASFFNPEVGPSRGGNNLTVRLNQDDRFILWMRTAALPTFRKLYGRIDKDLQANTKLTIEIVNRYNTFDFDGKKSLVLGTTTWLGGSSKVLGLAYLITGATSWVLGMFYAVLLPIVGRKIGDVDGIEWSMPRS